MEGVEASEAQGKGGRSAQKIYRRCYVSKRFMIQAGNKGVEMSWKEAITRCWALTMDLCHFGGSLWTGLHDRAERGRGVLWAFVYRAHCCPYLIEI